MPSRKKLSKKEKIMIFTVVCELADLFALLRPHWPTGGKGKIFTVATAVVTFNTVPEALTLRALTLRFLRQTLLNSEISLNVTISQQ